MQALLHVQGRYLGRPKHDSRQVHMFGVLGYQIDLNFLRFRLVCYPYVFVCLLGLDFYTISFIVVGDIHYHY